MLRTLPPVNWGVDAVEKPPLPQKTYLRIAANSHAFEPSPRPMNTDFFRALETRRTRALVERDLEAIEALHAPDYQLISPAGRTFSRAKYLEMIRTAPFYAAWEHGPIEVRMSAQMAVVRYQAKITFPSGKVVNLWHTDTYELRASLWVAVWSQATELPKDLPAAPASV